MKEVRRGQVSLSLLRHWAWTRERAKKKREEKKRGWCAFLTRVLRDREVTSHALKTHSTFQHTHSQAIHPSIPTSLHHIIIPPLSALAGLSPADRTVPARGAFVSVSHYGACNVGITPLRSVSSTPTWQPLSADRTSLLQLPAAPL